MFLASENIDFTGLSHVFLLGGGERCAFFLPFAQAQAAAYRSTPIQFPEKVRLCRTFSPLPVPQRHGLVRCADERGISHKVSTELCGYLRGTASHLEQGLSAAEVRRGRQDRAHRMPRRPIFTPHSGSNIKGNPAQLKLRRFT